MPIVVMFSPSCPGDVVAGVGEVVAQLAMDQMNLAQVRLRRVRPDARQVLNGRPEMRVTQDAEALDHPDELGAPLAERVPRVEVYREYRAVHGSTIPPRPSSFSSLFCLRVRAWPRGTR